MIFFEYFYIAFNGMKMTGRSVEELVVDECIPADVAFDEEADEKVE